MKKADDDIFEKEELDENDIEKLKNIDISSGDPEVDLDQQQRRLMYERRQAELRKLQQEREQVNKDLMRVKESAELHGIDKEYNGKIKELENELNETEGEGENKGPRVNTAMFETGNSDPRAAYMTPQDERKAQFFRRRKNKRRRNK